MFFMTLVNSPVLCTVIHTILCVEYKHWVHKKCSGLKTIAKDPTYQCLCCGGDPGVRPIDGRPFKVVQVG